MSSQSEWLVPERVIFARAHGVMTVNDVIELIEPIKRMLVEYPAPIHVLLDVSQVEQFPTNIVQLSRLVDARLATQSGWVFFVCRQNTTRFVVSVLAQLSSTKLSHFDTLQEALDFLDKSEPSLQIKAHWEQVPR